MSRRRHQVRVGRCSGVPVSTEAERRREIIARAVSQIDFKDTAERAARQDRQEGVLRRRVLALAQGWTVDCDPEIVEAYMEDRRRGRTLKKSVLTVPFFTDAPLPSTSRDPLPPTMRRVVVELYLQQSGRCAYCQNQLGVGFHVEHRLPVSRGGTHARENLCCACPTCNLRKGTRTEEEFLKGMA